MECFVSKAWALPADLGECYEKGMEWSVIQPEQPNHYSPKVDYVPKCSIDTAATPITPLLFLAWKVCVCVYTDVTRRGGVDLTLRPPVVDSCTRFLL